MRKLDKTETFVTIGNMTYAREVSKLTCTLYVFIFPVGLDLRIF